MTIYRNIASFSVFLFALQKVGSVPSVFRDDDGSPVIHTGVGSIRGLRADDGDYSMFLGIPYAEVDMDNPFGASSPYPLFEDTFDAIDDSAICPQIEEFNHTVTGSLDCLHLNIYVPNNASTDNALPVMVYIYGGMWSIGFAGRFLYGPEYIVRHDVILVTISYRVGPYGFMCLDIPEVAGNQGLKDQQIALRWINDNIATFGGDDTRVTVFGNSAGGMSNDLHFYYGQEQHFQRMIFQSGVASMTGAARESDPTAALRLAEYFNYTPNDLKDAVRLLATIDSHEIIAGSNELGLSFVPCVEKDFTSVESFMTEYPLNVIPERIREIDILIGYNNDESYPRFSEELVAEVNLVNMDVVGDALAANFVFGEEYELMEAMKTIVTHFYLGDEDITSESRRAMADVSSDFSFNYPTLRTAKKYLDNGVENLYLYVFSYSGGRNFVKHRTNVSSGGAAHADEIGYLFDISYMEKPMSPEDELIVDRMTLLWTNFAKYGNPTPTVTALVPVQWPRPTRDKLYYLNIDRELSVASRPMHARAAFLDLFYKANQEYQLGFGHESSAATKTNLVISLPLLFVVKCLV